MERETLDWSQRGYRRGVRLTAAGIWPDGTSAMVHVANLSYEGCELWSNRPFVKGEVIRLTLPSRGRIEAHIRWVKGERAGARFMTGDSVPDLRRARIGV
jgi:hypothetical protein